MINILIIEDHPMMIEGYKNILSNSSLKTNICIKTASNCETAYLLITKSNLFFDIILLDLALPSFKAQNLHSGEDLAKLIRKQSVRTKIMMLTSHTEAFVIYQLSKNINPEGLLIKSDFNPEEFVFAFENVIAGGTYYSISARMGIKQVSKNHNYLDAYDRRIISLLSKGIRTKSLPDYLGITVSAIDKRKAKIREFFNLSKGSDEDIIRLAKEKGLI